MEPQAQLQAGGRVNGVEVKAENVKITRSANGPFQVLLPRPLKAKAAAVMRTRKMKSRDLKRLKTLEAQQLETNVTKKIEIAKLNETRNVQMHSVAAKAVQNDGGATVLCPENSPSHLTLLIIFTLRVRPFTSAALTDRLY